MSEPSIPELIRFLANQTGWLAHRPEAEHAFDELRGLIDLYNNAIEAHRHTYVGPCDVCGRDMYAREGADEFECVPCALIYPVAARRAWLLEQAEDRLATGPDIARGLADLGESINPSTIRTWADRDRLTVRGRDLRGDPLYRVGDVRALAAEARRKRPTG